MTEKTEETQATSSETSVEVTDNTSATTGSENAGKPKETDVTTDGLSEDDISELLADDDVEEPVETTQTTETSKDTSTTETTGTTPEATTTPTETTESPETPKSPEATSEVLNTQETAQPQKSTEPQEQSTAAAPESSQEISAEQYKEFFETSVDQLATQVYGLDEETARQLDEEPSKVLPKLAATLHMQVLTAAVTQAANLMPTMMVAHTQRQTIADRNEEKFFTEYPQLKEHRGEVAKIAQAYRTLNPEASVEQAMKTVAAMSMVQLNVQPPQMQTQPNEVPITPPPPPAASKGAPASKPNVTEPTQWDELVADDE